MYLYIMTTIPLEALLKRHLKDVKHAHIILKSNNQPVEKVEDDLLKNEKVEDIKKKYDELENYKIELYKGLDCREERDLYCREEHDLYLKAKKDIENCEESNNKNAVDGKSCYPLKDKKEKHKNNFKKNNCKHIINPSINSSGGKQKSIKKLRKNKRKTKRKTKKYQ